MAKLSSTRVIFTRAMSFLSRWMRASRLACKPLSVQVHDEEVEVGAGRDHRTGELTNFFGRRGEGIASFGGASEQFFVFFDQGLLLGLQISYRSFGVFQLTFQRIDVAFEVGDFGVESAHFRFGIRKLGFGLREIRLGFFQVTAGRFQIGFGEFEFFFFLLTKGFLGG